jgi:hypothetical protein
MQNLRIGPTRVQIAHLDREWRIAASRVGAAADPSTSADLADPGHLNQMVIDDPVPVLGTSLATSLSPSPDGPSSEFEISRYATRRTAAGFRLVPLMADRAVVCRPLNPLFVMPGDQVEMFMSTPVWISVFLNALGTGDGSHVADIPASPLNETWVGSSTVDGELGYAAVTKARLSYKDVKVKPHLATTGVVVRNLATKPLRIDHLSLPAPWLHVYATPEGALCTDGIILEQKEGDEVAELEIMSQPLGPTGPCVAVGPARKDIQGLRETGGTRIFANLHFSNLLARKEFTP